jgi:hypothetical protein
MNSFKTLKERFINFMTKEGIPKPIIKFYFDFLNIAKQHKLNSNSFIFDNLKKHGNKEFYAIHEIKNTEFLSFSKIKLYDVIKQYKVN